jgi:hypothetical protein
MIYTMPKFLENKEWYTYDQETNTYTLTDKAPPEAVESYKEFLALKSYNPFWGSTEEDFAEFVKYELSQGEASHNYRNNRHDRKRQYLKEKAERKRLQAEQAQANATQKKSN